MAKDYNNLIDRLKDSQDIIAKYKLEQAKKKFNDYPEIEVPVGMNLPMAGSEKISLKQKIGNWWDEFTRKPTEEEAQARTEYGKHLFGQGKANDEINQLPPKDRLGARMTELQGEGAGKELRTKAYPAQEALNEQFTPANKNLENFILYGSMFTGGALEQAGNVAKFTAKNAAKNVAGKGKKVVTPKASTPVTKEPLKMSVDELEVAYKNAKLQEDMSDLQIFGSQEKLDRYNRAYRMAESSDPKKASEGSRIVAEMEDALTEAQQNKLFGIGEKNVADDYKSLLDAAEQLDFDSPQALGNSLKYAVTKVGKEVDPALMTGGEREAYYQLKVAFDEANRLGWDTKVISEYALKNAAMRFSDTNDAAYMLQRFTKAKGKQPLALQQGTRGIPEKPVTPTAEMPTKPVETAPVATKLKSEGVTAQAGQTTPQTPVKPVEPAGSGIVPPKEPPKAPPVEPKPEPNPVPDFEASKQKFIQVMNDANKSVRETETLRKPERGQRVAMYMQSLKQGEGREGFRQASKALAGKYPEGEFAPISGKFTPDEYTMFQNKIRDAALGNQIAPFQSKTASDALDNLFVNGVRPRQNEIDILREIFGDDFVNAIKQLSTREKVLYNIMDAMNMPRAVLSSYDISAPLRQGLVLSTRHPVSAFKSWGTMFKALGREKNAQYIDDIIRSRKNTSLGLDNGLYLASLNKSARMSAREELFMSRLAEKIPGVRASERAYLTFLNDLRSRVWENGTDVLGKMGGTKGDYKALAEFINWSTGRGTIPKAIGGSTPFFNAVMFSPRLFFARWELPTKLFSSSPYVRKQAWQTLGTFLGFGGSILGLAKLGGADIELDPRSSDFAKVKIGNTRLDFWTGFGQYARFVDQLALAERKTTTTGEIQELNRKEVVDRFLQSKMSPATGLLVDILQGRTYSGDEMAADLETVKEQSIQRLVPLYIQDLYDAVRYNENLEEALPATLGGLGVGVSTYEPDMPEQWVMDLAEYIALPSDDEIRNYKEIKNAQAKAKYLKDHPNADKENLPSRTQYRKDNPDVDAKLFVTGQVTSLLTEQARTLAEKYIRERKLKTSEIRGLQVPGEPDRTKTLNELQISGAGNTTTRKPTPTTQPTKKKHTVPQYQYKGSFKGYKVK